MTIRFSNIAYSCWFSFHDRHASHLAKRIKPVHGLSAPADDGDGTEKYRFVMGAK